jgi:hypothetical protein
MKIKLKKLSFDSIERSPEIQSWLNQFPKEKQSTAIDLLSKLRFVTRDSYSEWLKFTLLNFKTSRCAIYAIRKFGDEIQSLWDSDGETVSRPSSSLGSEDLVQSVVANLIKLDGKRFSDNPSLEHLKKNKIHDIVLLDDSIGSGQRVSSFIQMMMVNKTFRSWWSLGWIRLHILAFSRAVSADERIIKSIPGSDHHKRKHPKSGKVNIDSHLAHHDNSYGNRWGINFQIIVDLCRSQKEIPGTYKLGYDETMTNIVFYHSVPDNMPGVLWFNESKWRPLFPGRSVPEWLPRILDGDFSNQIPRTPIVPSEQLIDILGFVKRGIRNATSLAHSLGFDPQVVKQLMAQGRAAGLLTDTNRITEAGKRVLRPQKNDDKHSFNRSLYVPRISCVGWGTVQPSAPGRLVQTDSTVDSSTLDGEAGQASLERTDAKTASPSLSVMPQLPSKPRMGHDTHGPKG